MANAEHLAKIKQDGWNEWRQQNRHLRPDLREADLSNADLTGADLTHVELGRAKLGGAILHGTNLSGADLSFADLSNANLRGANLTAAELRRTILSRANLSEATLRGANLSGAGLYNADLSGADLHGARLVQAQLPNAKLRQAKLGVLPFGVEVRRADLSKADLTGADLSGATLSQAYLHAANLDGADLTDADLSGAELNKANLSKATLRGTNFSGVSLYETIFGDTDLASVRGLDSCRHIGPSTVDHRTLTKSGTLPLNFLRGCGLPDRLIDYLPTLLNQPIQFYSCFISYSTKDQIFADRLHADLQNKGVRCWFAPHDIQGGRKIHEQIDEAIRIYDRLLLILSEASMNSEWVKTEIAKSRRKEVEKRGRVLFPVTLVPFEPAIRTWENFDADTGKDSAKEIREYFIPDFSSWTNQDHYQQAFGRLLKDLRAEAN